MGDSAIWRHWRWQQPTCDAVGTRVTLLETPIHKRTVKDHKTHWREQSCDGNNQGSADAGFPVKQSSCSFTCRWPCFMNDTDSSLEQGTMNRSSFALKNNYSPPLGFMRHRAPRRIYFFKPSFELSFSGSGRESDPFRKPWHTFP